MIRKLAAYKIGQSVRDDGPQTHLTKAGTPTMGGALILVSVAVTTILWADWTNRFVWIVLAVTLGFGAIGWVDDYRKVVHRNPKGLSAREKYFWQSVIGLVAAVYLAFAVPTATATQGWALFTQWVSSGFAMDLPPQGGPDRAVLQEHRLSARRRRVHRAVVLRDRRDRRTPST